MKFSSKRKSHTIYDDDDVTVDNSNRSATSTSDVDEHDDRNETTTLRQVSGAAVVGGILGCCLLGPFVGIVAAGGAAALATSKGTVGTVARSTGDVAADAGIRLNEFNKKHRIVEKTSHGIAKGCHWVSDKLKDKPLLMNK